MILFSRPCSYCIPSFFLCPFLSRFSVTIHPQCSRSSKMIRCPNCLIRTVYGSHFFPLVLPGFSQAPMLRSAERARGENSSRRLRGRSTPELTETPSEYASSFGLFDVSSEHIRIGYNVAILFSTFDTMMIILLTSFTSLLLDRLRIRTQAKCGMWRKFRAYSNHLIAIPNKRCKTKVFDKVRSGGKKEGLSLSNWPNVLACHAIW